MFSSGRMGFTSGHSMQKTSHQPDNQPFISELAVLQRELCKLNQRLREKSMDLQTLKETREAAVQAHADLEKDFQRLKTDRATAQVKLAQFHTKLQRLGAEKKELEADLSVQLSTLDNLGMAEKDLESQYRQNLAQICNALRNYKSGTLNYSGISS